MVIYQNFPGINVTLHSAFYACDPSLAAADVELPDGSAAGDGFTAS